MSSAEAHRPNRPAPALLLTVLIVLALALRLWRLGNWGFDSDGIFTLRDSVTVDPLNPRPLLYFLNHFVVSPLAPLNEFGLRLLPAIFGVLAIPVFYFVTRRLVGDRAALFGALLLTFSPLHLYYSQFARYWSLVFLLSTVYPFAIYLGLREHNRRMLAFGLLMGVAAALAHPASVLLVGGLGPWVLATYLRPDQLTWRKSYQRVLWLGLFSLMLVAIIAVRFVPLLKGWISTHDTGRTTSEFLLHLPTRPGLKQIVYLFGYVDSLTLPLALAGALGIVLLWQGRNRSLAFLLACMFIFPVAFLVLLSLRTPVGAFYLVPTMPIVFIGAGVFLDRLSAVDSGLRPRWLLPTSVTLIILAAGAPTVISQYRDGRRYDFRGAARWLEHRLAPGDVVFSDQFKVLVHYLPGARIERLRTAEPLAAVAREQRASARGALWIVAPAPGHAFRTSPSFGKLQQWLYQNCQLRNTLGVGRVDFRQYYLQLYRCPPVEPSETVAHSE